MKYINEDLDYIFIRVETEENKWDNSSLREATDMQFSTWLFNRFGISVMREDDDFDSNLTIRSKPPTLKNKLTPRDRVAIINWLSEQGHEIFMIKREARNKN